MGACTSCSKQRKQEPVRDNFDTQPEDTHSLKDLTLPSLLFSAQLTKIKIKRCIYPSISMKFQIQDVQEFMIPEKQVKGQVAKWDVQHVFRFQTNQYQMRRKFLIITFYDKNSVPVGNLKINLYLLATGPFHQDFAIDLKDDPAARVSFNLKIAQIVKMKFQFLEAQMIPIQKQYPGDKFTFSVRSIMGNVTQYTKQSYMISVAFDEDDNQNSTNQKAQSIKRSDSIVNKRLKLKNVKNAVSNLLSKEIEVDRLDLRWQKHICQQMPSFSTQIALFDMHSSAFHIIYWKVSNAAETAEDNVTAECYVSINKLLSFESKVIYDQHNVPYQERMVTLSQKNWSHGKQVGTSNLKMKFCLQKHIKQMQVCVRTQQGILKSSPVFSRDQSKTAVNRDIKSLSDLTTKIDSEFMQIAKNRKQHGSTLQFRRSVDNILKLLGELKEILQKTVKQSIKFFDYRDQKQLLKGQQELIQIGFKTKAYIGENIDEISAVCFQILICLAKRGQMNLAYIGFNIERNNQNFDLSPNSFKNKKIHIALKYQELLHQLMNLTLFSLNFKGTESEKQFAELFCALAYFRIPKFRRHVLEAISRPNDPQIEQWRGTQYNLYDNGDNKTYQAGEQKNTYEILFDWENNFYKYIENQQKFKQNNEELDSILEENQWYRRINKRKGAFYSFVQYWCDYVQSIAVNSKNLKWKHFPGYNKILHALLVEMKETDLVEYTDRMDKALASLLNNEKLINILIVILYKKADVNDSRSILKLLDYMELFFSVINKKNRLIPTTFDYNYFFKGFKIVLEGTHCYSLGKALLLLYNHFNIFSQEFKFAISMFLMGKLFFRLFLHWSFNVRTIFHHLLYIRINKSTEFLTKTTKSFSRHERAQLRERYQKLMIILQNANDLKKKEDRIQQKRQEKDYYKRMKKKLYEKKNQKRHVKTEMIEDDSSSVSMRQLSYNPRKNSVNDERWIEELARPKLDRYNSELMSHNLKIAIEQAKQKKDEIIPIKTTHMIADLNSLQIVADRKDSSQNKDVKRINLLTQQDSEIWQMTKKESQYLAKSLSEYENIHELFLKHLAKNNNIDSVPNVKLEIAIDYEDIRPQKIDEW